MNLENVIYLPKRFRNIKKSVNRSNRGGPDCSHQLRRWFTVICQLWEFFFVVNARVVLTVADLIFRVLRLVHVRDEFLLGDEIGCACSDLFGFVGVVEGLQRELIKQVHDCFPIAEDFLFLLVFVLQGHKLSLLRLHDEAEVLVDKEPMVAGERGIVQTFWEV